MSLRCLRDSGGSCGVGTAAELSSRADGTSGVIWGSDSGKNVGESRDEMADLKSGGVTSDTNHGMSLGLSSR